MATTFLLVVIFLPRGTDLALTDEYIKSIEEEIRRLPKVQTVFTTVNPGSANFYVGLTPLEKRKISQQELIRNARAVLRKYRQARISVSGGSTPGGG